MAIRDGVRRLGLEIRVGVHTGECEVIAGKTGGIAAIVGARVREQAAPERSWSRAPFVISRLAPGSFFEDRGTRMLKGVPRTGTCSHRARMRVRRARQGGIATA